MATADDDADSADAAASDRKPFLGRRPTIYDVAEYADVSPATVSRVLSGSASVKPKLSGRVEAAVAALDYRVNRNAQGLRTSTTRTLAAIVPDSANPFFTHVVRGVEDVASAHGYSMLLCNSDEDAAKEQRYLQVAEQLHVDGLVIVPATLDASATSLGQLIARTGVPIVLVDRVIDAFQTDCVVVDNPIGAQLATQALMSGGHRDLACITGPRSASNARLRADGFLQAFGSSLATADDELLERVVWSNFRADGGRHAVESLWHTRRGIDGVFVANNQMTIGALEALRALDLRIPEDVGVVGFDDSPVARHWTPRVTVIEQPAYELGRQAGHLLMTRMGLEPGDGVGAEPKRIELVPELIVRASTRQPASDHSAPRPPRNPRIEKGT